MGSDANPNSWVNEVHFEVGFGPREPELWVITIELWEQHFGKVAELLVELVEFVELGWLVFGELVWHSVLGIILGVWLTCNWNGNWGCG